MDVLANKTPEGIARGELCDCRYSACPSDFPLLLPVSKGPQVPGIRYWMLSGGRTSERGADSAIPHMRAVTDDHGRILVVMTHNTDFGGAFEEEATNHEYFLQFSVQGYAVGVNTLVYALTCRTLRG